MTKGKGKTPGAGGLGKHFKSVVHKERVQPSNRKSLGHLEKHKDYRRRSRIRKIRLKRVQQLKRAAAMRNEDEFNVKMTQYKMDESTGKMRRKRVDESDNLEFVGEAASKNLKKAIRSGKINADFLERKAQSDLSSARKLSSDIGGLSARTNFRDLTGNENDDDSMYQQQQNQNQKTRHHHHHQAKHTVFVENEKQVEKFQPEKYFNTTKQMLSAPGVRGSLDIMGTQRVGHALDNVNDATLLRRFQHGDFDWDEELSNLRKEQQERYQQRHQQQQQKQNNSTGLVVRNKEAERKKSYSSTPLQHNKSLRDSLFSSSSSSSSSGIYNSNNNNNEFGGQGGDDDEDDGENLNDLSVSAPVLLRMLRRALILEKQHTEKQVQAQSIRAAKEVSERVSRATRLQKLAAIVKKKTQSQTNVLNQKKMLKLKPGVQTRQR